MALFRSAKHRPETNMLWLCSEVQNTDRKPIKLYHVHTAVLCYKKTHQNPHTRGSDMHRTPIETQKQINGDP